MQVICEINNAQYFLKPGDKIEINRLDAEIGDSLISEKILYLRDDDTVLIGTPYIENARVEFRILEHKKGKKILVFKKKRRKGYRRKKGHRQFLSVIEIIDIKY